MQQHCLLLFMQIIGTDEKEVKKGEAGVQGGGGRRQADGDVEEVEEGGANACRGVYVVLMGFFR